MVFAYVGYLEKICPRVQKYQNCKGLSDASTNVSLGRWSISRISRVCLTVPKKIGKPVHQIIFRCELVTKKRECVYRKHLNSFSQTFNQEQLKDIEKFKSAIHGYRPQTI